MPNSPVAKVARRVSLLLTGLFAGFLVGVLVLEVSLRGFEGQVYTQVRQVELESLDTLATVLLLPALLATGLLVVLTLKAGGRTRWLTLAAFALLVAIIVITFAIHIPINADQPDWNVAAPPSDWASVRDRWQIGHAVRTGAALIAFGALIAAATGTSRGASRATSVQSGASAFE